MNIPLYDNHLHLSPSGKNIEALKEFKAAGGTGLTLVTLPYSEVQINEADDFYRSFEITTSFAEKAKELGLKVYTAIGPYPILLISLAERFGIEKAEKIMMKGNEIACELISEGKADLFGEVGRPHFETDQKYVDSCNRVLQHCMDLAHQIDCAVMLHCESCDYTYSSLSKMASSSKLPLNKVVKHSSPPWVTKEETFGLTPSIPASRSLLREAISKGKHFMVETDYIDNPEKPGAMMSVNTVPKRLKAFLASGELTEEDVFSICQDIPDSIYKRD